MILIDRIVTLRSRSPCGERGLKLEHELHNGNADESLPVRGAWIEMAWRMKPQHRSAVAPRAGSVD